MMADDTGTPPPVLDDHEELVESLVGRLRASRTCTERVDLVRRLIGAMAAHDDATERVLCPLLRHRDGDGPSLADALEAGVARRRALLVQLDEMCSGVRPTDVHAWGRARFDQLTDQLCDEITADRMGDLHALATLRAGFSDDGWRLTVESFRRAERHAPAHPHGRPHKGPARAALRLYDRVRDMTAPPPAPLA